MRGYPSGELQCQDYLKPKVFAAAYEPWRSRIPPRRSRPFIKLKTSTQNAWEGHLRKKIDAQDTCFLGIITFTLPQSAQKTRWTAHYTAHLHYFVYITKMPASIEAPPIYFGA